MLYFSINSLDNHHLGFLVLMDENDSSNANGTCGYYAIKALSDKDSKQIYAKQWQILSDLSQQSGLKWQKQNDYAQLYNLENKIIGRLQHQILVLHGQNFLLNDLTGIL